MQSKVARWTQQAIARGHCHPTIARIIRHASNLRMLTFEDLVSPMVLSDAARGTLTHLSTLMCISEGLPSWTHICTLQNLRTLVLTFVGSDLASTQAIPFLSLPRLQSLRWDVRYWSSVVGRLSWVAPLSRCHLPGLQDVCFCFEASSPVQPLADFLRAHPWILSVRLERRLLRLPVLRQILPVVRASQLSMEYPPDSQDFLKFLSPDVRELVIGLDVSEDSQCSHLWEIFDSLAGKPPGPPGLRCVLFERQVRNYEPWHECVGPLLWNATEGGRLDIFRGAYISALDRLRVYAVHLQKVGMLLLDESGTSIAVEKDQVVCWYFRFRHGQFGSHGFQVAVCQRADWRALSY
jgi:hypothetical protein